MKRSLVLVALLIGCAHTKTTEKTDHPARQQQPPEVAAQRPPEAPGRPPLAASPEGLFVEGGVVKVQQALEKKGLLHDHETGHLDDETSAAIMKFQRQKDMAATGVPDHETIVKMGLSPSKLFRHAPSQTPQQAKQKSEANGSG